MEVDKFDISRVPTLNMVIADLGKGNNKIPCLEPSIAVFKKFLEKIRMENVKGAKEIAGKVYH